MKRILIITAVIIVLVTVACRKRQDTLRVGIIKPSIGHLPYSWGLENGMIDGAKYETIHFTSGWEVQEALIAGRIDVAIMPFTFVWNAATKGYPIKTVSFFERETDGILTQPHIRSAQDLNGKSVGVLRASTLDILWQDYAEREGIEAHTVYFRTPSEAVAALQSQNVDAIVIYVPIINKLAQGNGVDEKRPDAKYNVIHWFGDHYDAHPCCDLVANTEQITKQKKRLLTALLTDLKDIIALLPEREESVRDFIHRHYALVGEEIDHALEHTLFRMGLEESGKQFQSDMAVHSLRSGYLERIPTYTEVYWDLE